MQPGGGSDVVVPGDGERDRDREPESEPDLDPQAFDLLLAAFDADRDLAARRYEALRGKLVDLFRWRALPSPEDLADETLNRVARRIRDGEQPRDVVAYAAGVARLVGLEAARGAQKFQQYKSGEIRRPPPDDAADQEARATCLDHCLGELPRGARELILRYESGDRGDRIARRRDLAAELRIPLNALRIRAHRVRLKLEECLTRCMDARSAEMDRAAATL